MWLLDVNLPTGLLRLLHSHGISCDTTVCRGWRELTNGELVAAAFSGLAKPFFSRGSRHSGENPRSHLFRAPSSSGPDRSGDCMTDRADEDATAMFRCLAAAERAVEDGRFNVAKVPRAAAHAARVRAMNAERRAGRQQSPEDVLNSELERYLAGRDREPSARPPALLDVLPRVVASLREHRDVMEEHVFLDRGKGAALLRLAGRVICTRRRAGLGGFSYRPRLTSNASHPARAGSYRRACRSVAVGGVRDAPFGVARGLIPYRRLISSRGIPVPGFHRRRERSIIVMNSGLVLTTKSSRSTCPFASPARVPRGPASRSPRAGARPVTLSITRADGTPLRPVGDLDRRAKR